MRVLVTGATGFVGSHTAKALQDAGHTVRALVRTPIKLETVTARVGVDLDALETANGDAADSSAVTAALDGCDAAVHAAAVVGTDPSSEAAIEAGNFAGALNVLGGAADAGCDPIVHVSSAAALFPFSTDPVTVDHPVGTARMPYARSKAQSEQLARQLQACGRGVVIIYPGGVFGPGDFGESTQLKPLKLWLTKPFTRSTGYTINLVDVRDIAAVVTASMQPGRGPRRYMMFGHHLSCDDLLVLLCDTTGRDLTAVKLPKAVFAAWGRLGDLGRRFGRDLILTSEGVEYMYNTYAGDDSFTEDDTGVSLRSAGNTLADTIAWMHREGYVTAATAGKAAR